MADTKGLLRQQVQELSKKLAQIGGANRIESPEALLDDVEHAIGTTRVQFADDVILLERAGQSRSVPYRVLRRAAGGLVIEMTGSEAPGSRVELVFEDADRLRLKGLGQHSLVLRRESAPG
jgi:hypothetical protein